MHTERTMFDTVRAHAFSPSRTHRGQAVGILALACLASACAHTLGGGPLPAAAPVRVAPAAATPEPIVLADDLQLRELVPGVWLHTTFKDLPAFGRFPSNGLLLVAGPGAALVDTPWTPAQTKRLLDWLRETRGAEVRDLVVTHAHDDRVGGVTELPRDVRVHALPLTVTRAAREGFRFAATPLATESTITLAGRRVETFFPGPGHAPDNIVVWFPELRLLFGGCFVRAAGSRSLGNLGDADVAYWPTAASRLVERYAHASIVVPGHGDPGGAELLAHTRDLAREAARPTP
jgi:glyoxylase-like metal-dependent hydrolase (beta-lactamase superfamily II)